MQKFRSAQWNNFLIALLRRGLLSLIALSFSAYAAHAATVSINANPVSVTSGAPSTLTWSSTDVSNCSASGAWSGVKSTSGTQSIVAPNGLNSYILNCSGPSGSASNSVVIGAGTPAPAVYALNVTLSGSGTVTSNPSGIVCGATCSASYPSGAAVTLSAIAATGYTFTGWSGACSGSGACVAAVSANRGVTATFSPPSSDLIFFDNFEYVVDRNATNAVSLFQQNGGWTSGKAQQSSVNAHGYLYTVNSIPGYIGAFPGANSGRVLAMEALPGSLGGQTDFYLQYGDGENAAYDNAIPGNVWFQFWIYINHYGNQLSQLDGGNKFIYPCNSNYPCGTGKWLMSMGGDSYLPFSQSLGVPSSTGAYLVNYPQIQSGAGEIINDNFPSWDRWKLGQTNISQHMITNRWTLVKIHIDTSTASGSYETWMKPLGGQWTKTTEWVSGVTPGFSWTINPGYIGGHRVIRMPTTIGSGTPERPRWDAWIYMDDFAISRSEAALPQY